MKKISRYLLTLLLITALCNCKKDKEKTADNNNENSENASAGKGLGDSRVLPDGPYWKGLPDGIEWVGQELAGYKIIEGYDKNNCGCNPEIDKDCERGGGINNETEGYTYVQLCVQFKNTTSNPITFSLPPGLLFISFDAKTQNGLLIKTETFEVPPGIYNVKLNLFCANAGRGGGGAGDKFTPGPVLKDKQGMEELTKLIEILEKGNKDISDYKYEVATGQEAVSTYVLQDAVWDVTNGKKLSPELVHKLSKLRPL